jgi:hypothetical protein
MLDPKEFVRSICHGRARIRHASLRGLSPEEVESLTTMIAGFDGITSVKLNPRVGSLLVTWDETKTNAESLLAAAQFFLPDEPAAEEAAEVFEGAQDQDAQPEAAKTPCCASACLAEHPAKLVREAGSLVKSGAHRALDLLAPVVAPDVKAGGRTRRVTQNRLMAAGYALSLAGLAFRGAKAHLLFGALFTVLLGVHLYQHRRVL